MCIVCHERNTDTGGTHLRLRGYIMAMMILVLSTTRTTVDSNAEHQKVVSGLRQRKS